MWLLFDPLQHVSFHLAYTANKQVVYCHSQSRFSWLLTLISLRREENGICSYSLKHPHIPIFKENKRKLNPKVKNRTSLATF